MKSKLQALTLGAALAFLSLSAPATGHSPQETGGQGRTWAVVIGISRYPRLPGGQQLQFAERDAADFAEAITKAGVSAERVRLLLGQQATSSNIKSSIGSWLARSAWGADTVYVFFSGHAFVERDFGEAYLLGFDSDLKDPYSTGISLNELSHALSRRIRAGRVLVIADAIRRDLFPPESDHANSTAFFETLNNLAATRPGLTAIVANGPGEFSREGQRWGGRGVFTKHLLDGLSGGADLDRDGSVTASEAFEYLSARVPEDTSNRQRPWRTDTAIARMILGRSPLIAQSTPQQSSEKSSPRKQEEKSSAGDVAVDRSRGTEEKRPVETRKPPSTPPATGAIASTVRPPSPDAGGSLPASTPTAPAPPLVKPVVSLPETARVIAIPPPGVRSQPVQTGQIAVRALPPPPRPSSVPPSISTVAAAPARNSSETIKPNVPVSQPGAPPSPLALQIEAAIAAGSLIEPKNSNAWDLFLRLSQENSSSDAVTQLKPKLALALLSSGRAIVGGDVRSDNISDKVEEFKRAGQVLARARSLAPDDAETQTLEKLCASAALIALQFYDEAERSLSQLQGARLAAVENALGILYRGKFDDFRAERAFKRSIEIDPKWAAPHYNLALLYKNQKRENVLDHLSRAAQLDPSNPALQTALGDEHFERQQWQPAIGAYSMAVALKPGDDTLHTKLGHALYSNGARDEANSEYQKAAEIRKRRP